MEVLNNSPDLPTESLILDVSMLLSELIEFSHCTSASSIYVNMLAGSALESVYHCVNVVIFCAAVLRSAGIRSSELIRLSYKNWLLPPLSLSISLKCSSIGLRLLLNSLLALITSFIKLLSSPSCLIISSLVTSV